MLMNASLGKNINFSSLPSSKMTIAKDVMERELSESIHSKVHINHVVVNKDNHP